ncbi:MAG TPA: hypothetical protein RMH26_22065, partial [Polyangiaceae bacterium LLY-WYZ-15_(1-7)]|nr:hypothetical protein [Polyangiaceae bacterium LLY-WYZ-15_(1-7)]
AAAAAGWDVSRVVNIEDRDAREVFERLIELAGERTLIVGLGNIGGLGLDLVRLFRNRARRRPALAPLPDRAAPSAPTPAPAEDL